MARMGKGGGEREGRLREGGREGGWERGMVLKMFRW